MSHEITQLDANTIVATIDTTVYSRRAIFGACYKYTDRCYLFLAQGVKPVTLDIVLSRKDPDVDLGRIKGEFFNELLDYEFRAQIAAETKDVRTLIVAQAFAEGNLLDPDQDEGNYIDDPRGIRQDS